MRPNDVVAVKNQALANETFSGKKVIIKAPEAKGGLYLSIRVAFDASKDEAFVYDYDKDGISQQYLTCLLNDMPVEIEEVTQTLKGE